ncbi:MAG: hypothetical protein V2B19_04735 [Pseudomonadota bacterium]
MHHKNPRLFFAIGIMLVIGFMRFYHLEADPDVSLTKSGVFFTDEGWHAGNAVKKYLTGQWICDARNHILLMPLVSPLLYCCYKLLGLSLFVTRLPFVIFSLIQIVMVGVFVFTKHRESVRVWNVFLFYLVLSGTDYYFFIHSRVALLDIPMATLGVMAVHALAMASTAPAYRAAGYHALSGVFLSLAFLMKPSAAVFMVVMIIMLLIKWRVGRHLPGRDTAGVGISFWVCFSVVAGVSLSLRAGFSGTDVPYDLISSKIDFGFFEHYLGFVTSRMVLKNAPLFILAGIQVYLVLRRSIQTRHISFPDNAMVSLFLGSYLFFGFFNYKAERYLVIFSIPLSYFLAGLPITFSARFSRYRLLGKQRFWVFVIIVCNAWNIYMLTTYYFTPRYSLKNVAHAVKDVISRDSGGKDVRLHGAFSSTLSLVNQLDFLYCIPETTAGAPIYFITHETPDHRRNNAKALAEFDMLGNYYENKRLYLQKK